MRRNNTESRIQKELLFLKEQNFRLRELATKGEYVEKLQIENQKLIVEINKYRQPQNSDGFLVWQNKGSGIASDTSNAMTHTYFSKEEKKDNIFLTEPVQQSQEVNLDEVTKV